MELRTLGRSELKVSPLCFGGNVFGWTADEAASFALLDRFADALIKIAEEAHTHPELLKEAPHNTPVSRLDEVKAAKELVLCCWLPDDL